MVDGEEERQHSTYSPSLTIDWDLYGAMLDDSDLTEEEKKAVIGELWGLVLNFVDLGFGIHPLQQVEGKTVSSDEADPENVLTLTKDVSVPENMKSAPPPDSGQKERSRRNA